MGCQHPPTTYPTTSPQNRPQPHPPARNPSGRTPARPRPSKDRKTYYPTHPKKLTPPPHRNAIRTPQKQQSPPHKSATCQQQQATFITTDGRIHAPSDNTNQTHYSARKQHNQHPPRSNTHSLRVEPTDQTPVVSSLEHGQLPYRDRY